MSWKMGRFLARLVSTTLLLREAALPGGKENDTKVLGKLQRPQRCVLLLPLWPLWADLASSPPGAPSCPPPLFSQTVCPTNILDVWPLPRHMRASLGLVVPTPHGRLSAAQSPGPGEGTMPTNSLPHFLP